MEQTPEETRHPNGGEAPKVSVTVNWTGVMLSVLIMLGIFVAVGSCLNAGQRSVTPAPISASTSVGDVIAIRAPRLNSVPVAVNESAYTALIDASVAGDADGIQEALRSGHAFTVASGTKARILESRVTRLRVRITEGPSAGRSGWIPREWAAPW